MIIKTHYDFLGVPENATQEQIRKAYRRLVMKYHPDRSGDKSTTDTFVRINEAYQVLSDPSRRADYDAVLRLRRADASQSLLSAARRASEARPPGHRQSGPAAADAAARIAQAAGLFAQGKYDRAAAIANLVLRAEPRSGMAHAILGDVARLRQDFKTALKHYAYAVQFDPRNHVYAKKYEDLVRQTGVIDRHGDIAPRKPAVVALWTAGALSGLMMGYVALAHERPLPLSLQLIQTWTVGLVVMLFVNGVIIGAGMAVSQTLDRWDSVAKGTSGKLGPAVAVGLVAAVNFWASALLYVFLGLTQNSFTYSISRLITVVGVVTTSYAVMAALSPFISWQQTLIWGGNIVYIGALCGWAVADAFR